MFKSVYAFTRRPETHSGAEACASESYVWSVAVKHWSATRMRP